MDEQQKKEMRIKIAKDVLASLAARAYKAGGGGYIRAPNMTSIPFDTPIKDFLKRPCTVCALGAMFFEISKTSEEPVSSISTKDKEYGFWTDRDPIAEKLSDYFSKDQLDLIEACFEGFTEYFEGASDEELKRLNNRMEDLATLLSRRNLLEAIMKNIVENDGTFIFTMEWADKIEALYA